MISGRHGTTTAKKHNVRAVGAQHLRPYKFDIEQQAMQRERGATARLVYNAGRIADRRKPGGLCALG
jgi:hypothetical protein